MSGTEDGPGAARDAEERILVVCTRYIGDTILAIPFLRNLRRAFPGVPIDIFAEGAARAVLADCPYVDRFVSWARPAGRRSLAASFASFRSEAAWLAGRHYSRVYLLKRSLSAGLVTALAGIPTRIGLPGDGRFFHTRCVSVPCGRHQADRYLDLLRAEGITVDDGHTENWIAPETQARMTSLLATLPVGRPRVFVAVQSTAPEKHWPAKRWAALVEWLIECRGAEVILCGGHDDLPAHDALRADVGPELAAHIHDFTQDLSLREASGLLASMDLCVGVDTGLVHLAASHGVPVAVLFGPTDPNQWSPWTARAVVVRSSQVKQTLADRLAARLASRPTPWPLGEASMNDIGVDDVVVAITSLLPDHSPTPDPVLTPAATAATMPAVAPLRRLDLREGSFRYEVVARDAAAALPATKPLAQAH